jgi:hypothetical protein
MRKVFGPALAYLPANKRRLRFHDIRHTAASLLIAQGTPAMYVKARLGHASITTTIDQYGHLFPSVEESLADSLDAMYSPSEGQDEGPRDQPTPLRPANEGRQAAEDSAL